MFQNGPVSVGCVSGEIFCRYFISSGHLFVLNCASVLRVYLVSVFSVHIFLTRYPLIRYCLFLSVGVCGLFPCGYVLRYFSQFRWW